MGMQLIVAMPEPVANEEPCYPTCSPFKTLADSDALAPSAVSPELIPESMATRRVSRPADTLQMMPLIPHGLSTVYLPDAPVVIIVDVSHLSSPGPTTGL